MTTHIMADLETLGVRPGAIVTSVALVRFHDEAHCAFNLSIPDQQALGLEVDPATEAWWAQQDPVARQLALANPLPLASALPYLSTWIQWAVQTDPSGNGNRGPEDFQLWCHGATFDCPLLGEVYRRAGVETPWKFWQVRDTRTLYDLALINPKDYAVPPPHVALNDAIGQTRAANAALAILARAHSLPQPVAMPSSGTLCSVCRSPQFETVHGTTCANGHGAAEGVAA